MPNAYNPKFEAALAALLTAALDTAEFADGKPHGRSRTASIRRLAARLDELQKVSAAILLGDPHAHPQRTAERGREALAAS